MPPSTSSSQLSGMSPPMSAQQQQQQGSYATPYNPQEWGPITASPNVGIGVLTPATTPMSAATSRISGSSYSLLLLLLLF